MDILEEIVAHKRVEVERFKAELSEREIHRRVEPLLDFSVASMSQALTNSDSGIIAEFKRKSPSKGWIKEDGRADIIPLSYQQNGASALSILADEKYFGGSDEFIKMARHAGVNIPILYKNFVIDEYQLFQARLCGASAVLLIAADLTLQECRTLLHTAHELGVRDAFRGRTGICSPRARYVRHQQPQPRFVRDGCAELLPFGRTSA